MSATLGPPLPDGAVVIRLVINREDYYNPKKGGVQRAAFIFSRDEEQDPPHRLSVFDERRTTLEQARRIHGRTDTLDYRLSVEAIREIAPGRLDVVEDPLPSDHRARRENLDGIDGHSAILGLDRRPNETSAVTRNFRSRLTDLCNSTLG